MSDNLRPVANAVEDAARTYGRYIPRTALPGWDTDLEELAGLGVVVAGSTHVVVERDNALHSLARGRPVD